MTEPHKPQFVAIPAPVDPAKDDAAIVLSQAPPMSLTGPKPIVDKPAKVVASQFHLLK